MLDAMVWIWLGAVALALFLEAATISLVSVWFAVGALAAVFAAYGGMHVTGQLLIFVVVSIAAFFTVRPLTRRFVDPHITPSRRSALVATLWGSAYFFASGRTTAAVRMDTPRNSSSCVGTDAPK